MIFQRFVPVYLLLAISFPGLTQEKKPDPSDAFFKHPGSKMPIVEITTTKEAEESLKREPRKDVACDIKIGDIQLKKVAIHIKGAAGSTRAWTDRPGLTLNTEKLGEKQELHGLVKFHLNNGVQDGSYMNELIANDLALAMGLPACRCTHAAVVLNGRHVGPYVFKEGFNKDWLKRNFKNAKGNLYDGGFLQDIDANLKLDTGTPNDHADLKALANACREPDANKRYAKVSELVNVDLLCTNAALQIITADWDGYFRNRNNYRVYFEPKGKAVFIPHGMDQLWRNPHEGWPGWGSMVGRAILDHPEGKKLTIAKLKLAMEKHYNVAEMHKKIDMLVPRMKETLNATNNGNWAKSVENEANNFKNQLKQRYDHLSKEVPKFQ